MLGSGFSRVADSVECSERLPYAELERLPAATVAGHRGQFVFGSLEGVDVAILDGRLHLYEGHRASDVVAPLRAAIDLGAHTVVLTNAAGNLVPEWQPGELMVICDHLNLTGHSPLIAPGEVGGPRFIDMANAYDAAFRQVLLDHAAREGLRLREGTYAGVLGPSYETPAEVTMLARLGAHAVGMSTVLECIAARQLGARVVGVSCLTNYAAGLSEEPLTHEDVQQVGRHACTAFEKLLRLFLRDWKQRS